jgi:hypothetical protein
MKTRSVTFKKAVACLSLLYFGAVCPISASSWGDRMPTSFDEAVDILKSSLPKKVLEDLKSSQRHELSRFNTSIGNEIRNSWFWGHASAPLSQHFFQAGIRNPDHMSGALLAALWKDIHKQPRDTEQLLNLYRLEEARSQDFVKETVVIPRKLASIKLTTTSGKTLSLFEQRGRVTVIGFLSSGPNSPLNVDFLNAMVKKYGRSKVNVIGFLDGATDLDPKSLYKKNPPIFPVVSEFPRGYIRQLSLVLFAPSVRSLPSNIILDRSGQMVWRTGEWTDKTIEESEKQLAIVLTEEARRRPKGSD